ncbi:alpha/beta hydrolase [Pandoraea commovens]|uniref:Carboxylesterase NlhH n=1 Tax=Pandoraea commovens TaxID=2508289 RepID=A0A5E4SP54_9BURK|nr:alpha/beta hydrolase [Pandoraea commovens]VVD77626.1 Carboxylesterase NlhH [Pandoraea commovens]
MESQFDITDVTIDGYLQRIPLRSYRPHVPARLPVVLCFHGGGFVGGELRDSAELAARLARSLPAWVVDVGYSLAPHFPFPAASEDAYLALKWAVTNASAYGASLTRLAAVGVEAGGNIAASLAAIARDRSYLKLQAQVLISPLLDPSMTRLTGRMSVSNEGRARDCAQHYRAYLPTISDRIHPYAAPLESKRLAQLPPTLVVSAEHDLFRAEGEAYASELIPAGVPVVATRHRGVGAEALTRHTPAIEEVVAFLRQHLSDAR